MSSIAARRLKKTILAQLKAIRKKYAEYSRVKEPDKTQQALSENYYLLANEALTAAEGLKYASLPSDKTGLPRLYARLFELTDGGKLPSAADIDALGGDYDFTVCEVELFELCLRAALFSHAYEFIKKGGDKLEKVVYSFSKIYETDFDGLFLKFTESEKILLGDKAFALSDKPTRAYFRNALCQYAKKNGLSETEAAQKACDEAKRNGTSLCAVLENERKRQAAGKLLTAAEIILPIIVSAAVSIKISALYLLIPLAFVFREILDVFFIFPILRRFPIKKTAKTETGEGLPEGAETIIAVCTLLPESEKAEEVKNHLREVYLSNRDDKIKVCLLADLKGAASEKMPNDEKNIKAAEKIIDELNEKYPNKFIFMLRRRRFVKTQGEYCGRERKRGAAEALVKYLKTGNKGDFIIIHGKTEGIEKTKYMMSLDSDTLLGFGSVRQLAAAAEHPLNAPVINEKDGTLERGFGIFTPKIETDVVSAYKTVFSTLTAGTGGVCAYDAETGERYQNLSGSSVFTGKGLINVDVFYALLCGKFREERILSHDIIEGEFLRTAYVPSATAAESFPSNLGAFFARLNRWIRGDVQNLPFVFGGKLSVLNGEKNRLGFFSRFKILENVRRALTPIVELALILSSVFMPSGAKIWAMSSALICAVLPELVLLIRALFSRAGAVPSRYFGEAIPETALQAVRVITDIALLPQRAVCCADAVLRAAYRTAVSKKNLLKWTTAADSEKAKGKAETAKRLAASALSAAWLFLLSDGFGIFTGFMFLAALPFELLQRKSPADKDYALDFLSREKIKSCAEKMYGYYNDYCNEKSNFLPCDNVQLTPVYRAAARTSPTNIGLMLCSFLAARDMSFITSECLYEKITKTLDTVNKLKKYRGNLYNWYSTETLEPLKPEYISSVDSGNFLCCLTVLKQGLREYEKEFPLFSETIEKIEELMKSTDLSFLYDKKRRLFRIGYNVTEKRPDSAHYDLLMSEARMTSYYAVAKKQVPTEHWAALSRSMSEYRGYYAPVSWSGTAFEYFMPNMFLPAYKNTLEAEALSFCVCCQKAEAQERKIPWGISESGYYGFDGQLNYQYRAHGVRSLAMRKSPFCVPVVSPYSSFLCLPFDKKAASKNIAELQKYDSEGAYGFFEALDFTDGENGEYSVVRSYMAHHIGMSIISADNALFENIMQKRFMSDDDMLAAKSLTQEKISRGAIKVRDMGALPDKPEKGRALEEAEIKNISVSSPGAYLLSNGEWTSVVSDCGAGHAMYGARDVTRRSKDVLNAPLGVFAFVKTENGVFSMQRAVSRGGEKYTARFDRRGVLLSAEDGRLSGKTHVTVYKEISGENRKYTVKNLTDKKIEAKLAVYFEPSMAFYADDRAHRAFSSLFVTAKKDEKTETVVISRRERGARERLCCACGFKNGEKFACCLSRRQILKRPDGVFSLLSGERINECNTGCADVGIYVETPLRLEAGEEKGLEFFICAAENENELTYKCGKIRAGGTYNIAAKSPFAADDKIMTLFPRLFFECEKNHREKTALAENTFGKDALARCGIYGNNPVILVKMQSGGVTQRIKELITLCRRLAVCGTGVCLVIAYSSALTDKKDRDILVGETGGDAILVDVCAVPEGYVRCIEAHSAYTVCESGDVLALPPAELKRERIYEAERPEGENRVTGSGFEINARPRLPWCFILANSSFGTLVSDCSAGFTFALNSYGNKLTPWSNDVCTDNAGERLLIRLSGKTYDLIRSSSVFFGGETAKYSANIDGLEAVTLIGVPERGMRKDISVEFYNFDENERKIEAVYYCEAVLGDNMNEKSIVKVKKSRGALELYNPDSLEYGGVMRLGTDGNRAFSTTNRKEFFEGKWRDETGGEIYDGCAALGREIILPPRRKTKIKFVLSYGKTPQSAEFVQSLVLPQRKIKNGIVINTGDRRLDELFNLFLPNQIIDGRLFARCGFYQCGGAYGFRDQLQDCLAVIPIYPEYAKRQLARCAAAQFPEGDVLHWWHTEKGGKRGVRTRYSDDPLWLCYVLSQYVLMTGDAEFLNCRVNFLGGEPLRDGEEQRYELFRSCDTAGSMLFHAERAIKKTLRFGAHALLLMGGGDWNDGMNKVGIKGRGESVWLSEFACMTLESMAQMYYMTGKEKKAEGCRKISREIKKAIDENAFFGDRYARAFCDDGSVLGTAKSEYCKIDSLPQSFAVLCGMPDEERRRSALAAAYRELFDRENGVVKLLMPAFPPEAEKTGYISAYPEGLRENGGQYTHAAVWLASALLKEGLFDRGEEILGALNPLGKYENKQTAEKYTTEPYYFCADVYTAKSVYGMGGWSLYTGSAAWYYKVVLEDLLGIKMRNGSFYVSKKRNLKKSYTARIFVNGETTEITALPNGETSVTRTKT